MCRVVGAPACKHDGQEMDLARQGSPEVLHRTFQRGQTGALPVLAEDWS